MDAAFWRNDGTERFDMQPVVGPEGNEAGSCRIRIIIEVGSQSAGIIVRAPGGYQFFAASRPFNRLEGKISQAREAERAAKRLADGMTLAA